MYQKILFLFIFSLFLLSAGSKVHSQTEVLWSKYFSHLGGVKFSKDGKVVAVASKDTVFLFDAYTGEPTMYEKIVFKPDVDFTWVVEINELEFTNNGKYLLISNCYYSEFWDFAKGNKYKEIWDRPGTSSVALLPDSRHMVTADQTDNKNNVFIWDIEDSVKIKSGDLQGRALDIAVSGDGRYISFRQILGSSECVSLWSVDEFQQIERLDCIGDYENIGSMSFSPNGKYYSSTDLDGYIHVWDLEDMKKIVDFLHTDQNGQNLFADQCLFSSDSRYLFVGGGYHSNKTTKVWTIPSMELIHVYENPYGAASINQGIDLSFNDSLIAIVNNSHYLYIIKTDFGKTSVSSELETDTLIYPNPVKDILILPISHPITSDLSLKLFNSSGEFIKLFSIEDFNIDSTTIKLNISYLIPSAYFINITSNGFSMTYSFIKI
jgi:WD40 repeat protein